MAPASRFLSRSKVPISYHLLHRYRWFRQHETIDKLNIQAHKNAISSSDDYVMDSFITFEKVSTLMRFRAR